MAETVNALEDFDHKASKHFMPWNRNVVAFAVDANIRIPVPILISPVEIMR